MSRSIGPRRPLNLVPGSEDQTPRRWLSLAESMLRCAALLCLAISTMCSSGNARAGGSSTTTTSAGRPNIVLIIADDQGWADYGFMRHEAIETPSLDRLARESFVFRRGYVPTSLCRPSLLTLLTRHDAHSRGVPGNDPAPQQARPDSELYRQRCAQLIANIDRFDTLPELLAERGHLFFLVEGHSNV